MIQFVLDASMTRKLRLVGLGVAWSFARTEDEDGAISAFQALPCGVSSGDLVSSPAAVALINQLFAPC